jgi:hypothetical protein
MCQLADQAPHGLARQSRVGVERDDIAHAGRNRGWLTVCANKGRIPRAAQQLVQLMELAALALPSHPLALSFAPHATAMEEVEAATFGGRSMHAIQSCDALSRDLQERRIAIDRRGVSVGPVRKQSEVNFTLRGGEVVHFETLDLCLYRFGRRQQRGHDHDSSQVRWNALVQRQSRQHRRAESARDRAIDQCHGQVESRNRAEQSKQPQVQARDGVAGQCPQ